MKELGNLKTGESVYDLRNSRLSDDLRRVIDDVLADVSAKGKGVTIETVDLGVVVGKTICVEVDDQDTVFWAKRYGKDRYTKFVFDREPEDTSKVTVILKKNERGEGYVLLAGFFGGKSAPEPEDTKSFNPDDIVTEHKDSLNFWEHHALIPTKQERYVGTTLRWDCPW